MVCRPLRRSGYREMQVKTINQESLRDTKGLDQWKTETRKEIRGIMKEVEKCIPQVESLLENK